MARLFEITSGGDPYSRAADIREYKESFDEDTCIYCGDLSGRWTKRRAEQELRRMFPCCIIRRGD